MTSGSGAVWVMRHLRWHHAEWPGQRQDTWTRRRDKMTELVSHALQPAMQSNQDWARGQTSCRYSRGCYCRIHVISTEVALTQRGPSRGLATCLLFHHSCLVSLQKFYLLSNLWTHAPELVSFSFRCELKCDHLWENRTERTRDNLRAAVAHWPFRPVQQTSPVMTVTEGRWSKRHTPNLL